MSISELRFIQRYAEFRPKADSKNVPSQTRNLCIVGIQA
jgi:hypothetical protein